MIANTTTVTGAALPDSPMYTEVDTKPLNQVLRLRESKGRRIALPRRFRQPRLTQTKRSQGLLSRNTPYKFTLNWTGRRCRGASCANARYSDSNSAGPKWRGLSGLSRQNTAICSEITNKVENHLRGMPNFNSSKGLCRCVRSLKLQSANSDGQALL